MRQVTIGLDFGTHQTKVCIESREGAERTYEFLRFKDQYGYMKFTLPSIIHIDSNGLLNYGYIPRDSQGKIVRYFKQALFNNGISENIPQEDAQLLSIWYISFILFQLENQFGQNFSIQMGAPMDRRTSRAAKMIATSTLVSAYRLVEDMFEGDLEKFLSTPVESLKKMTDIVKATNEIKDEYGILVFPEAYACLKPLTSRGKIGNGMSLMVDIEVVPLTFLSFV